jgi:hypothetical protein
MDGKFPTKVHVSGWQIEIVFDRGKVWVARQEFFNLVA